MKGKFSHTIFQYIFGLFFIFTGSYLAIQFVLWGIAEVKANHVSAAIFSFGFAVWGLLFGIFSVLLFRFNKNAYFVIENGTINARFGWDQELHTDISNIKSVDLRGKHIKLLVVDRVVWIYNLQNAKEVCEYISSQLIKKPFTIKNGEVKKSFRKCKKEYIIFLVATIISVFFLFFNMAWCVILTEGKELYEFSETDDLIFVAFTFAEVCTVLVSFLLAQKCGKRLEQLRLCKFNMLSAAAWERKCDLLENYSNIINKKYFNQYTYRIIVFSPQDNIFAYMLERFDMKTNSWVTCYEAAKGFTILSELYEDLDETFADVILED